MENAEAPKAAESTEKPVVERKLSPREKAAMAGYIPLNTNPIDRFTPLFFKENYPAPEWPVFEILKPTPLDRVANMEANSEAVRAAFKGEAKEHEIDPAGVAREIYETAKEKLSGFSNYKSFSGEEIKFEAGNDKKITDDCLKRMGWQVLVDVRNRYFQLFELTVKELESLG